MRHPHGFGNQAVTERLGTEMDVNTILARIRELLDWWDKLPVGYRPSEQTQFEYITEMNGLLEALDEWMAKGGFLPTAWTLMRGDRR